MKCLVKHITQNLIHSKQKSFLSSLSYLNTTFRHRLSPELQVLTFLTDHGTYILRTASRPKHQLVAVVKQIGKMALYGLRVRASQYG
jgi:hypothetical protein